MVTIKTQKQLDVSYAIKAEGGLDDEEAAASCPVATWLCENISSEAPVITSIPAALGKDSFLSWINRP